MKYADGPSTQAEITIDGTIDAVWELVSDISLSTRFSNEVQTVEWVEGTSEPAVGAQFIGSNQHAAVGQWQATCTITAFDPRRLIEWRIGDVDQPAAIWRFSLDGEDGSATLTQWCQIGPGPSGLTPVIEAMPDKEERIVAGRLEEHRKNMAANLQGVKDLVEGSAA